MVKTPADEHLQSMKHAHKLRAAGLVAVAVAADVAMTVAGMIAARVSVVNRVGKTQRSKAYERNSRSCPQ